VVKANPEEEKEEEKLRFEMSVNNHHNITQKIYIFENSYTCFFWSIARS
jgi:hypothetical protein